jgi:hypothetical protein
LNSSAFELLFYALSAVLHGWPVVYMQGVFEAGYKLAVVNEQAVGVHGFKDFFLLGVAQVVDGCGWLYLYHGVSFFGIY